jgi:hypothetical protein
MLEFGFQEKPEQRAPKNPMPFVNAQVTNCVLYPIHMPVAYEKDSRDRAGQGRTLALSSRIVRFSTDQNLRVGQRIRI